MKTQRDQYVGTPVSAATKAAIIRVGGKGLSRFGSPGLLAGDAVEFSSRLVCDACGVEDRITEGMSLAAGAGASALAGATIGASGGPIGAVVGGGAGLGIWLAGKVIDRFVCHVVHKATSRR